jgi:hypothetical protein
MKEGRRPIKHINPIKILNRLSGGPWRHLQDSALKNGYLGNCLKSSFWRSDFCIVRNAKIAPRKPAPSLCKQGLNGS